MQQHPAYEFAASGNLVAGVSLVDSGASLPD
jgi:hypothetical protein